MRRKGSRLPFPALSPVVTVIKMSEKPVLVRVFFNNNAGKLGRCLHFKRITSPSFFQTGLRAGFFSGTSATHHQEILQISDFLSDLKYLLEISSGY